MVLILWNSGYSALICITWRAWLALPSLYKKAILKLYTIGIGERTCRCSTKGIRRDRTGLARPLAVS